MATYNPYAVGNKRYNGAGTSANFGRTLDPSGYIDRSNTQQAAQRMRVQQGLMPPPSQERSGLAQAAMQRRTDQTTPQQQGVGKSAVSPQAMIPAQPVIREPNPTWDVASVLASRGATQPVFQTPRPSGPSGDWLSGGSVPATAPEKPVYQIPRPTGPIGGWLTGEDIAPTSPTPKPTPTPVIPKPSAPPKPYVPPKPAVPKPKPKPPPKSKYPAAKKVAHGNLLKAITQPMPSWKARAPKATMPAIPTFKGGTTSLEYDLRDKRAKGYTGLISQLAELANSLRDSESQYLQGNQTQQQEAEDLFRDLLGDYGARGVIGSSSYGQDYIDTTTDVTRERNELDTWLGRQQRDTLGDRTESIRVYQNLLNELNNLQAVRTAQRRANQKLKR